MVRTIVIILSERAENLLSRKLLMKQMMMRIAMCLFLLAGGMMIARNMPYSATDKAETILIGRMLPIRMPRAVPIAQHGAAKQIAP